MRTQELYFLLQSGSEIRVAIETDGERVGGLLNDKKAMPVVDGRPSFDYREHMQHLVLQLDTATDAAVDAEDEHSGWLIRVSRLVGERDEAVRVNYSKLVAARQGLEGAYKGGGYELAFMKGDTPRVPEKLYLQLEQTVHLLREPAVELKELKAEGFSVDFEKVAGGLEKGMQGLRSAIDRLAQARKEAEGTLIVKREAIDELRRTILWVGRTTEGLFHLAGEDELAKRIRSSTRRPQRPSEKVAAGSDDDSASESQTQS